MHVISTARRTRAHVLGRPDGPAPDTLADTLAILEHVCGDTPVHAVELAAPAWHDVHLYAVVDDHGCAGPELSSVLAHPDPIPFAAAQQLREELDRLHSEPQPRHTGATVPEPDTWSGTMGELWDAYDAATAAAAAHRTAWKDSCAAAAAAAVTAAGFTELRIVAGIAHHGTEYGSENPRDPLALVVNHGCRCCCGGTYIDDDLVVDATTPAAAHLSASGYGKHGWRILDTSGAHDTTAHVAGALTEAEQRRAAVIAEAAAAHLARVRAAHRTLAELEAMTVAEYREHLTETRTGFGRRIELRPTGAAEAPVLDVRSVVGAADRAYLRVLADAGVHLVGEALHDRSETNDGGWLP